MKPSLRLHLLGASGSGTTTLGRALARRFHLPFLDADDLFWEPTDPPFTRKRAPEPRARLLEEETRGDGWLLSGSAMGWADGLRTRFTHVLFLALSPAERLARIRARERSRHGARIEPGGDMHAQSVAFLEWAAGYDDPRFDGRSRHLHERWLKDLPCPVLRLDGALPTDKQLELTAAFLSRRLQADLRELPGPAAAPLVDPFYAGLGRTSRARSGDHFFLALAEGEVVGCVRYCVEEGAPMLRGMLIAETARKQGVGQKLLGAFAGYLQRHAIGPTLCLPHAHLESFYATVGFRRATDESAPSFLRERLAQYRAEGMNAIFMRRE